MIDVIDLGGPAAPTPVPVPTRDVWVIPRPHLSSAHTLYSLAVTTALAVVMAGRFLPALPVPDKPPSPAPAPSSALGRALAAHYKAAPSGVVAISARVRSGELKTAAAVIAAFADEARPAADALKATVTPHCDEAGAVTDAPGLADALKRAGEAAGGK